MPDFGKIVQNQGGSKHDGIGITPSCFASLVLSFGGLPQTGGVALTKFVESGNLSLNSLVVDIFRIRIGAIRFHALWGRQTGLGEEMTL